MAVETTEIELKGGTKKWKGRKYNLTFSDGNHQYRVKEVVKGVEQPGKGFPSVTSIVGMLEKGGLVNWAARITADYILKHLTMDDGTFKPGAENRIDGIFEKAKKEHKEELERAGRIGTLCHEGVENYLQTGKKLRKTKTRPAEAVNAFNNFVKWWENSIMGSEVHSTEQRIFHPEFGYTGTLDICATITPDVADLRYIIDVKTSNGFYAPEMSMQLAAYAEAYELIEGVQIDGIGIIRLDKVTGESYWKDYTAYRGKAWQLFKTLLEAKKLLKGLK